MREVTAPTGLRCSYSQAVSDRANRQSPDHRGDEEPPNFGLDLPTSAPFTVEGQIEREVALLAGAKRVGGWRKWAVYFFYALFTAGILYGLSPRL
jgi:hypothetical protein